MPYEWRDLPAARGPGQRGPDAATGAGMTAGDIPDIPARRLILWPHRSLPRRGYAGFILLTFALITLPLYPLLGTAMVWGLLPFLLLAVAGLWWALARSYRDGQLREELTISPRRVHLLRTDPDGRQREWDCESYWTRVHLHDSDGPVPDYVTLAGKGREVEIGAFLSQDERRALYDELRAALVAAKRGQTLA
ncbi:MAG: DUF2244 domain-containing protein [Roseovarius sp.]